MPIATEKRFLKKVKPHPNGCLLWAAFTNPGGYGRFCFQGKETETQAGFDFTGGGK